MFRTFFPTRAAMVASLCVTAAFAQAQANPDSNPILRPAPASPTPASTAPRRTRAISDEAAAAVAAAMPKYVPAAPKPAPKPESEEVDLREVDKPKNGIVRLPRYIVQEPKPAIFSERAISTDKGLKDIAMRRYISDADRALNRFTLPLFGTSAESRALAMYAEDERLRNLTDLRETAMAASKSDAAAGTYIKKEAEKTYLRSRDFGWSSGGPK
jgi:hypothetical protein